MSGERAERLHFGEFALREQAGETPTVQEYQWRFPELGDRLRQMFEIHHLTESVLGRSEPDPGPGRHGPGEAHAAQQTQPDAVGQQTESGLVRPETEPDSVGSADRFASHDARPGRPAVPGYRIESELGRGGMGVVYLARQLQLNRPCALKMILAGAHADSVATARFLTEAQAVARLQHPNVVQIHHIGEADGLPFFELEYLEGGSLDQKLDGTPWPPRRAAALVEALARAVAEAHRLGIVHRDLKPGNVLLAFEGTPKIADLRGRRTCLFRTQFRRVAPAFFRVPEVR
jgi:hypothetical protein